MKKITLLLLTFFISLVAYGQGLTENFDGGTTLPGGWTQFNNAQGAQQRLWTINTNATFSASAPNSAFVQNYQIGMGNTSRDWLTTTRITLPENAQLQFLTRAFLNDDQGTIYEVRVSRDANPATTTAYTLAEDWSEQELNPTGIYEDNGTTPRWDEKTVNLKALGYNAGEQVYIAFVRVFTQPTASLGGDRWYIDDVRVSKKCEMPTNMRAPTINMTNAVLAWDIPTGGANDYELIIVRDDQPMSSGTIVNVTGGTYTIPLNTLNPDTNYKYYLRAVCSATNKSDWTAPYFFTTAALGETCADPIVMPGIPYSTNDNTSNSNDRSDVAQGTGCGAVPTTTNYMTGNEVFYTFVAPTTGDIRIKMTPTGPNSGVFVYNSCANVGVSCIAGVANTGSGTRLIPALAVTAGQTYIVVISSTSATQTVGYYLELQYVTCPEPTNLSAPTITQTSVTLAWDNPDPAYATWEVAIQPAGAAVPGLGVHGTEVTTNRDFSSTLAGAPIVGSTAYQYWVRALCVEGGTTYSPWAGPFEFFTPICDPTLPNAVCTHNFRLTGTNGWQGAVMHVRQNGVTVKVLGPQFTSGTSLIVPVSLCNGIPFELVWVSGGTTPANVGIVVQNSFGQLLYQKTAGTGTPGTTPLHTEMVDCEFPKCPPPINLGATGITANGATLTWTPASLPGPIATTEWEIYLERQDIAVAPSNTAPVNMANATSVRPNPRTGLASDTPYVFYIRTICGPNRTSVWVGPFTFRTSVSCGIPTNLGVRNQQTRSADLFWTQPVLGGASNWQVVVQDPGAGAPTYNDARAVDIANGGTYGAAGVGTALVPARQYEYYVRAVCSTSPLDVSRWVGPFLFTTACEPLPVPYSEGFNSTSTNQLCWSVSSIAGTNTWNMNDTATPFEGNEVATFTPNNGTGNDDWLISPTLDLRRNYRIRYKYKAGSATAANTLQVLITNVGSNGATAPTDFNTTPLWSGSLTNTTYQERIINLIGRGNDAINGDLVNIAFRIPPGTNNANKIFIDDVVFEPIPACPDPMDLGVVAGSITSTSGQIFWTPGYQETQWQVAVQPIGTGVPSATFAGPTTTNNINFLANTNTVNGTPLQPGNQYEVYVRAICADPNVSQWVGPIVFRTLLCETVDMCAYTFTMTDTASNGWGTGVNMSVIQNGLVIATLNGPANGQPSATQVVNFCPGVQFELFWNPSTATPTNLAQVGVSITNFYGEVVYTKPAATGRPNSRLYRGMPYCSTITCPYPTNLTVEQTSSSSANISWTPGGTETVWEYVFQPAGGPYPGSVAGTRVTVPNANILGLPVAIPQEYYVRAICGPDNISYWSGPYEFTLYNSPGCIGVDIEGVSMSIGEEKLLCPSDNCIDLSASYFQTQATTSYRVESIAYAPPFPLAGTSSSIVLPITVDDDWSPLVDLTQLSDPTGNSRPFNFCFFGDSYSKLLVTDNGAITFSIAGPQGNGGMYTPGSDAAGYVLNANSTIPLIPAMTATTQLPYRNSISGVLQDLDPGNSPADASINYTVLGTAPCRAFVLNIYRLSLWGSGCNNGEKQTSQIVLYEGSNIIDIYVEKRTSCSGHNGGRGVIGLQGDTNTEFAVPPGRNTGTWQAEREGWRFIPNGANSNVVFKWLKNGEFYSNDLNINVCVDDVALMEAVALYDKCDGTNFERKAELKLKVDEFPINEPNDLLACTGTTNTFNVTANTQVILDGVDNADDYEISYYLTLPEAEDGTTPGITSVTSTVVAPIYVRIEKISTGCYVTREFNVDPTAPLPAFTVTGDTVLCEGDSTTITVEATNFNVADAVFEWTLPDGTISSQTGSTFNITAATTADAGAYSVKVTAGCDESLGFTVQVNKIDTDFTYPTPVCPSGTISPIPVTAATFTAGGSYQVSPALPINTATGEITLDGATAGDYTVTYTVTPAITNCTDDKTGQFIITIAGTTIQPVVAFNYTTPVCKSATTNPMPNLAAGFTPGGEFTSTDANISVNLTTGAIDLANTQPGTYTITYTVLADPSQCKAGGTDSATIVITAAIAPVTSFGYADDSFCSGGVQVGQLPTGAFDAGGRFTVEPGTGLNVNPTTGEFMPGATTPGTYVIKYVIEADPALCRSRSESSYTVTIENTFDVIVTDECRNNEYVLIAEPSDPSYTFLWKDALGAPVGTNSNIFNVSQYVANLSGEPQYPLNFTVTISTATGCQNIKPVVVESTFCDIQKGISPNNDGKNDYFDLAGFNVKKLSIFNRYGTEVYSRTNYTNQWRGQSNNDKELPDGTYYYVIERSGVPSKTGWIQINRQTK